MLRKVERLYFVETIRICFIRVLCYVVLMQASKILRTLGSLKFQKLELFLQSFRTFSNTCS